MKYITKADFLNTMTCPTLGWGTYNNTEKEKLTFAIENRLYIGNIIGQKARERFIKGITITGGNLEDAIFTTKQLLNNTENEIFFEAAFESDGFVARADILIKTGKKYKIIEVKSSTEKSVKKAEGRPYLEDLAYTCWVAEKTGLKLEKSSLYFLSKEYRFGEDETKLFAEIDSTTEVKALLPVYESKTEYIKKVLSKTEKGIPNPISDCKNCPMKNECHPYFAEYTIYQLPGLRTKKYLEQDMLKVEDIEYEKLNEKQKRAADCIMENEIYINKEGIKEIIGSWEYPIAYFDFETVSPPIPVIKDTKPYERLPFQYSLHIAQDAERDINTYRHEEYLANPKDMETSIMELAAKMVEDLKSCKTIVAYHDSFEKGVVQWLAEWTLKEGKEELSEKLTVIKEKFVDLKVLIQDCYYDPKFKGSYSIKKTLPVLVPDLSYDELAVGNGNEATTIFLNTILDREEELEQKGMILPERKDMLEYCKLDTWAMVVLKKELETLSEE